MISNILTTVMKKTKTTTTKKEIIGFPTEEHNTMHTVHVKKKDENEKEKMKNSKKKDLFCLFDITSYMFVF